MDKIKINKSKLIEHITECYPSRLEKSIDPVIYTKGVSAGIFDLLIFLGFDSKVATILASIPRARLLDDEEELNYLLSELKEMI